MKDRAELDEEIDALAAWIPAMLAETDEASQMDAFAGRAELIEDQAGPDDASHVRDCNASWWKTAWCRRRKARAPNARPGVRGGASTLLRHRQP